jgi:hypothetical protein
MVSHAERLEFRMLNVSTLGGAKVHVTDDCRLEVGGVSVTLRPNAALRLSENLIRAAVRTATREAALSVAE